MSPWLFSRRFDLAVFLLPALVALLLVPLGPQLAPSGETPLPLWVIAVLFIDVGHVWSTLWRTYLDRGELARRPGLYAGVPLGAYLGGVSLAMLGSATFWTVLAYLAAFHFVRQQYGWVRLYQRRDPGCTRFDRHLDAAAIYAATVFPLLWWHAHLPRRFDWFLPGDFLEELIPEALVAFLWPLYLGVLAAFVLRQLIRWRGERTFAAGKVIVVLTTAACWGVGMIATNSDWAFTVTNVIIHGVPYFGLVWFYGRRTAHAGGSLAGAVFRRGRWGLFLLVPAALAYLEELGWDRLFWHERGSLFPGPELELSSGLVTALLLPLLALPQLVHYLLDGFIWRTRENPAVASALAPAEP